MTSAASSDTITRIDAMVTSYVRDLESLPNATRLSEASQATVYAMACALLQRGQLQQASNYFSFLLLYAPTHPDYLCAKASCAMQSGNPHQAVELLSLALYVQPESCAIALALAEALISAESIHSARQILLLVCKLAQLPAHTAEHMRAGLLLQTLASETTSHAPA